MMSFLSGLKRFSSRDYPRLSREVRSAGGQSRKEGPSRAELMVIVDRNVPIARLERVESAGRGAERITKLVADGTLRREGFGVVGPPPA
jgi:hypothetical protein